MTMRTPAATSTAPPSALHVEHHAIVVACARGLLPVPPRLFQVIASAKATSSMIATATTKTWANIGIV